MVRRIVVHAGMHLTGTTTAQAVLAENSPLLWPTMALGLRDQLQPILSAARGYATWRDPASLQKFRERAASYLSELSLGNRDLLISSEELCGRMPGQKETPDYSAAPTLLAEFETVLQRAYPEADLSFVLTLRDQEDWLTCIYWEHVKSSRMILSFEDFKARLDGVTLTESAKQITAALQSRTDRFLLEDIAGLRFGPATPLIDLMKIEPDVRKEMTTVAAQNQTPQNRDAVIAQFLKLNRSRINPAALKAAKAAILERA